MIWSVAIFSSRESPDVLISAIRATVAAAVDREAIIDVMINGNRALAEAMGTEIKQLGIDGKKSIRVWDIAVADKAHAWNQYIYSLWPGSEIAYFVDGYAEVWPDAFRLISDGLDRTEIALGASGVPTMGRSAKALQRARGAHGNLCAIRGDVMRRLREISFRFPLGLYRSDGLIFAVISFGLDPAKNEWNSDRLLIVSGASWNFRPLSWWKFRDLRAQANRMLRQAQGILENRAIREHLAMKRLPPSHLARTAFELVESWVDTYPTQAAQTFIRNPLCLVALRRMHRSSKAWAEAAINPLLVAQRTTQSVTTRSPLPC